jgi:very-short-patch-repair endonuclease
VRGMRKSAAREARQIVLVAGWKLRSPPPLRGEAGSPKANREGGMTDAAHRPVSKLHRGRAKALRREMTNAERCLWFMLRGHRFKGLSFRRQAPIGPFIIDFVCQQHRLIVEIDGGQHAAERIRDQQRDEWLSSKGYLVLRFWNTEVLRNRPGVLQTIVDAVASQLPPSLSLPLKGGGDQSKPATQRNTGSAEERR